MKTLWLSIKWIFGMFATIVGAYMAVEHWVIGKANTVVEPVKSHVEVLDTRQRDHQERVERELLMIRSQNNSIFELIVKKNT